MTIAEHATTAQPAPGRPQRRGRNALSVAEESFVLLTTGPRPLAVDGGAIGHGLPARPVDLAELRTLLLAPSASDALKDATWRFLVNQARTDAPAWVIGCVGVAMPGLKNTAARILRTSPPHLADDVVSEMLTEFVTQLHRIDLARPHIAARLVLWARKAALRLRAREAPTLPCAPDDLPAPPRGRGADVDPADLVYEAVRQRIITPEAGRLITLTRLEGVSVQDLARRYDGSANQLYKRRHAAETRLVAALADGRLSPTAFPE